MQRWNFSDEASEACDAMAAPSNHASNSNHHYTHTHYTRSCSSIADRPWTFSVLMNLELCLYEKVAVVGNCDGLGNWQPQNCVVMNKDEGSHKLQITNFSFSFCVCTDFTFFYLHLQIATIGPQL